MIGIDYMTCRELSDLLGEYVAGTLDAPRREELDAHLEECADCVKYLSSYWRTIELGKEAMGEVEAGGMIELPPAVLKAILAGRKGK